MVMPVGLDTLGCVLSSCCSVRSRKGKGAIAFRFVICRTLVRRSLPGALLKVFHGNACASAYGARRELFTSCEMKKPTNWLADSMLGCIGSGLQFLLYPPVGYL